MQNVVTFGEAMIRLSPPCFRRLEQANELLIEAGGAELNVAIGLNRLGINTAWVSKLPDNPLGKIVANKARGLGVDVDNIIWTRDYRLGLYFVEFALFLDQVQYFMIEKTLHLVLLNQGKLFGKKSLRVAQFFIPVG